MSPVEDVQLYARRLVAADEDPDQFLLDAPDGTDDQQRTAAGSIADTDVADRPYRLVSHDSHPLVIDVHEGGNLQIYGFLRFRLPKTPLMSLAIELSIVGMAEVKWPESAVQAHYRQHVFLRSKESLLVESDAMPKPVDPVSRIVSMPFAIFYAPSPFPITFKSPSATISYSLVVRFRGKKSVLGTTVHEHSVPIVVAPPWSAAPPPELPDLKDGDNGVRVVVDVDGSVHGSVQMFGAGAKSEQRENDEDSVVWLRPRVLHDGMNRPRAFSIGMANSASSAVDAAEHDGAAAGGGQGDAAATPPSTKGKQPAVGGSGNATSPAADNDRGADTRSVKAPSNRGKRSQADLLGRNRSNSFGAHSRPPMNLVTVPSRESIVVPIVMEKHSSSSSKDMPFPYTSEDPLASNSQAMRNRSFSVGAPSKPPGLKDIASRESVAAVLDRQSLDLPLPPRPRANSIGVHAKPGASATKPIFFSAKELEAHYPGLPLPYTAEDPLAGYTRSEPTIPKVDSTQSFGALSAAANRQSPDYDWNMRQSMDSAFGFGSGRQSSDFGTTSAAADVASTRSRFKPSFAPKAFLTRMLSTSRSKAKATSPPPNGRPPSVATIRSAYQLETPQSVTNSLPYAFDFLLASTIIGPNTQFPITVTFKDTEFDADAQSAIEIALVADVCCGDAALKQKHDYITLSSVTVPIDTEDFEKAVWFRVPSTEKLGYYASGFKILLVELSHKVTYPNALPFSTNLVPQQMVFRLLTPRRRKNGSAPMAVELGSVGITILEGLSGQIIDLRPKNQRLRAISKTADLMHDGAVPRKRGKVFSVAGTGLVRVENIDEQGNGEVVARILEALRGIRGPVVNDEAARDAPSSCDNLRYRGSRRKPKTRSLKNDQVTGNE
ncbi:hypothetical protein HDU83_007461 [Entophlyctis luteolus]|nr:hypothetical protein HDU83_007461 [Entophlyctis luteolus]